MGGPQRLQKVLAAAGVASRRASEGLIRAGRVRVNGSVVTDLGTKADPSVDLIEVDGSRVTVPESFSYFALDKPVGFTTTMDDPHAERTVAELFPAGVPGLFPVGRLDRETSGLLLVTNDGELAARLTHPRHHVAKTYVAAVRGIPEEAALERLREGVALEDGVTAPAEARVIACSGGGGANVEIVLREGRKRQVRRMLDAVGHPVVALRRTAFGPVRVEGLPSGECVALDAGAVAELRAAAGL